MLKRIFAVLTLSFSALVPIAAFAQCVSLTNAGATYTQNFDTLANTGSSSTLPTGWQLGETGTAANTTYTAGTGSGNSGDSYSFGATASTDRALGSLRSNSLIPAFGACFTNNTGSALASLNIAYVGEEWRLGTITRTDQLTFEYSTDANSLATGTWTAVATLNFVTPITATTGAKDGNAAANRTALSSSITLPISSGATFWIRWTDPDASGADDGLAVDDFSLTPVALVVQPNLTIANVSQNEGNVGASIFSFTVNLSAPAGVGGVTFNIATQDGTAKASSDYVAKNIPVTIAQGDSSYIFTVDVNGDTITEGDETFSVIVSSVVGANNNTAMGAVGTIVNDDPGVNLTINNVTQAEGNAGTTNFSFNVTLSGPAPVGGVTFDIATANGTATAGTDYVAQSIVGQTIVEAATTYTFNVVVNGDATAEPDETFFVNLANISGAIPLGLQATGTIVTDDSTRIHALQGSGTASPLVSQLVTVEGIVTASYQGPGTLLGYFIQEPDNLADADPTTSEGVFVFTNATPASVTVGDLVRVTGTVTEFGTAPNTLTEIGSPTLTPTTTVLSSGNALPAFITVSLPIATVGDLERYEGMRVRFMQTLTVSDHFDLAHFGEITVTANGRAIQPTNVLDPNDDPATGTTGSGNTNGAAVTALGNLNARSALIIDGSFQTYPATIPFLEPATNTIRLGSTVSDVAGILGQIGGTHRVYPDVPPVITYAPRPITPPVVGGNVKVASMNVLNYFNGNGLGAGFPTSRGADSINEFNRQRAKVLAAILGLDADVVGLLEIENDGNAATSSIQDLINGLNSATAPGTWAFIPDPAGYTSTPGGGDEIRPAIIYKTAVVAPDGASLTSSDAAFSIGRSPVAQTFRLLSDNEKFTLVVNHFKSKSSSGASGADLDQGDGQAAFNNRRKLQATALLSFIGTLTAATPRVITMGDFNAYEQEDPIDIMRAGGLATIINNDNSYMFDGLSGSLDHALGTAALTAVVSGAGHWHINADEPIVLDYNVETKNTVGCVTSCTSPDFYAASPFRASDHDPVLVGLLLPGQCQPGYFSATGNSPCTGASAGNFVPTAGATSQFQCSIGTFQPASRTSSCFQAQPGNFVAVAGATAQTACLAGSFQMNSGAALCDQAQPGNFVAGAGAISQTACSLGTFQMNAGATSCDQAQPGNFVNVTGATSQTACLTGTFQAASGASSCGPAQPGNFVAVTGATSQTACLAGTFQMNSGATSCDQAQPGNFVSVGGATSQTACLAGSFQMNSGATSCDQAQPGNFVSMLGAISQTACSAGTFQASSGATSCVQAQPGNFVATAGAASQTACLAGTFQMNAGAFSCDAAQPGNFAAGPGATAQTACAAGSFQPNSNASSCGLAQPGFFVANTGAISQTMCPAGTTSTTAGATSCSTVFFNVSPSAGLNGSISPRIVQSIAQGTTTTFMVSADAGYSASVGGTCGGSFSSGTFTTNAIIADCTVDATFTLDLAFVAVQSRKFHGATPYDIAIDTGVGAPATVEPRTIGTGHTIVFQFNVPITAAGTASVVDATSASIGTVSTSASGNDVIVTITGVPDNQRVVISLTGVNGTGSATAQIGFLTGDTNNTRSVTASDISGVKARSGQPTTAANFKFDVNASGSINSADISAVKARSGLSLP